MPSEWYVVRDGKELGPFTPTQLKEQKTQGTLTRNDLVRRGDLPTPVKANNIKGLFPPVTAKPIHPPTPVVEPTDPPHVRPAARRFRDDRRVRAAAGRWKLLPRAAKIGVAAGGGFLALIFVCCGGFSLLAVVGGGGESSRGVDAKTPAIRIQSFVLFQEYEANEVAADEKYRGKVLQIQGPVHSIEKSFADTIYVTLDTIGRFQLFHVKCYFADQYTGEAARLQKGQWVTIRGRCDGKAGDVIIRSCSFAK